MAFQLFISDTPVDMDPGASLSLNFVCPAFDTDSAERGYSLPFRLSHTPSNLMLLKHKQRLDTAVVTDALAARVVVESQELAEGVYKVEKSSGGFFDGHFENTSRANLADLASVKLSRLCDIVIPIPKTVLPRWYLQIRPPNLATGYSITIDDHFFSSSTAASLANAINTSFGETLAIAPIDTLVILSPPADGRSLKILNGSTGGYYNGIYLLPTSYTQIGAQRASFLHFVHDTLDTPREDISFAMMSNTKLYDSKNPDWSGLINFAQKVDGQWQVGRFTNIEPLYSEKTDDATAWKYTYIPFVRVSFVLNKIAQRMGVSVVTGLFDEWAELSTLLIYNNRSLDDVKQAYEFDVLKYTNGFATAIDLKNHVPDMTAAQFLSDFCETYNLWWNIEDERLVFRKKDNILRFLQNDKEEDWSGFLVAGSDERGYKEDKGFKLSLKTYDSDAATSDLLAAYTESEGDTLIELPTGILPEVFLIGWEQKMCFSEQVRSNTVDSLRFMFDRGLQNGFTIQYVTTGCSDHFGALSLSATALADWAWRESAAYRARGWFYSASFELPILTLRRALQWSNALRRIETPNGSLTAAINTIEVTEKVNGSAAVKVEFWVK